MRDGSGITILEARSGMGYQYAKFEIRTDWANGFDVYTWQSGQSAARLWKHVDYEQKVLVAQGDEVTAAMDKALQTVHAETQWRMSYREFQLYVYGWIAGKGE